MIITKNTHTQKEKISVPCMQYTQGGFTHYNLTLNFSILSRFIDFDSEFNVFKRSQRKLSDSRAKKIVLYVQNEKFIIPPLVGAIEGFTAFEKINENFPNLGILHIELDSLIKLFDGQHRTSGIISAYKNNTAKFKHEGIALVLVNNIDIDTRQQFFADINSNVSKPSLALSYAYNKRDIKCQLAMYVINNTILKHLTNFETNIITGNDINLFSFKTITDTVSCAMSIKRDTLITENLMNDAVNIFNAWGSLMHWHTSGIGPTSNWSPIEYRKENIGTHGVILNAIGMCTKWLLENTSVKNICTLIKNADINMFRDFKHSKWVGICVDKETGTMLSNSVAIKKAAEKLVIMLNTKEHLKHSKQAPAPKNNKTTPLTSAFVKRHSYHFFVNKKAVVLKDISNTNGMIITKDSTVTIDCKNNDHFTLNIKDEEKNIIIHNVVYENLALIQNS